VIPGITQHGARVVTEGVTIRDARYLPWTVCVGTTLGRARPTDHLAAVLGDAVLTVLWRPPVWWGTMLVRPCGALWRPIFA
jgi:hypothetical protein